MRTQVFPSGQLSHITDGDANYIYQVIHDIPSIVRIYLKSRGLYLLTALL